MKTIITLTLLLLTFTAFAQEPLTNAVVGTNSVVTPAVATGINQTVQPILDLLKGSGTWITTLIAWFAAISAALAPFAVWIRNKLANMINTVAESSGEDDDEFLRRLFSAGWYRILAFVLNFANVRFPTLAELERAIAMQREAVLESKTS